MFEVSYPIKKDSTPLSNYIEIKSLSKLDIEKLFKELNEYNGNLDIFLFPELKGIFSYTLTNSFYNIISSSSNSIYQFSNEFLTNFQNFFINEIKKILINKKYSKEYLDYFSLALEPFYSYKNSNIRFCGEVFYNKDKFIGILFDDLTVELHSIQEPDKIIHKVSYTNLKDLSINFEMIIAEIQSKLYFPKRILFRSFTSSSDFNKLPLSIYSLILNLLTDSNMSILGTIINSQVENIHESLLTIFSFLGIHRKLLKYCIYNDLNNISDPSQIMRGNSISNKCIIEFVKKQLFPLIPDYFIGIKTKLVSTPEFTSDSTKSDDLLIIEHMINSFIESIFNVIDLIPSSIRFTCKIAYEASICKYNDTKMGIRAIFMLFFFRVVFPLLCQPHSLDPPDMTMSLTQMTKLPKILACLFSTEKNENLINLKKIFIKQNEKINIIYDKLKNCNEPLDDLTKPNFEEVIDSIDKLRKRCSPFCSELSFAPDIPSPIIKNWLQLI